MEKDIPFDVGYGAASTALLLQNDFRRSCQMQRFDEALDAIEAILAIARVMRDEPFSLASHGRDDFLRPASESIHRALAQGELAAKRLAAIQVSLEEEDRVPHLVNVVRVTRAQSWEFACGRIPAGGSTHMIIWLPEEPPERPWYLKWLPNGKRDDLRAHHAQELRRNNLFLEFAKKPPEEQVADWGKFVEKHNRLFPGAGPSAMWKMFRYGLEMQMYLRTTRTAIALERYRQTTGNWPRSLDQLVPDYLADVPIDFYSRKPLVYRRVDCGVVVYSVGWDGKDHDGQLRPWSEQEHISSWSSDFDLGVRLWDVKHRRQPPAPPVLPPASRK